MPTYYAVLTNAGQSQIAAAIASGVPVNWTQMAVGDGNGNPTTPDASQTALVREVFRANLNRIEQDPNNLNRLVVELIIPEANGGWTIREGGIFDGSGNMVAVCNFPPTYKPAVGEGSASDVAVRMNVFFENTSAVTLIIDPGVVMASRQWVIDNFSLADLLPGGTTGQILRKASNADGDTEWVDPGSGITILVNSVEETQTLAASQTVVNWSTITANGLAVYIEGARLRKTEEWTQTGAAQITLAASWPAGTKITGVQNEEAGELIDPLQASFNLSDLENVATARNNLNVYSKTEVVDLLDDRPAKPSCRVASTANLAALSGLLTIDGVTLVANDRVLVKDQTTGSQNGIYVAASGAWTRATDFDSGDVRAGDFVYVTEGAANADTGWLLITNNPITVGTTALTFTKTYGSGQFVLRSGDTMTGNLGFSGGDIYNAVAGSRLLLTGGSNASASGGGAIALRDDTASSNASGIEFYAGGSERVRLANNGNLLVGTTSDNGSDKLQVEGSARMGRLSLRPGSNGWWSIFGTTDASNFGTFTRADGTTPLAYLGGGNGGAYGGGSAASDFGVQVPSGNFFVSATSMRVYGNNIQIGLGVSGQGGNTRYVADNGTIRWLTGLLGTAGATHYSIYDIVGGADRLIVRADSGNVLIGTTTDDGTSRLQVSGNAKLSASGARLTIDGSGGSNSELFFASSGSNKIRLGITGGANVFRIYDDTAAVSRFEIRSNGSVLIGTTTDDGIGKLQVDGAVVVRSPTTANLWVNASGSTYQALIRLSSGGLDRWILRKDSNSEAGSNNGSDFTITRYDDAGSAIDSANPSLSIKRSTGNVIIGGPASSDDGVHKLKVNGAAIFSSIRIGPGGGAAIHRFSAGQTSYANSSIGANSNVTFNMAVSGARADDACHITADGSSVQSLPLIIRGRVTADNTVQVTLINPTGTNINLPVTTFTALTFDILP